MEYKDCKPAKGSKTGVYIPIKAVLMSQQESKIIKAHNAFRNNSTASEGRKEGEGA